MNGLNEIIQGLDNNTIKKVIFDHEKIDPVSFDEFLKAFKKNTSLEEFHWIGSVVSAPELSNNLEPYGYPFSQGLKNKKNLKILVVKSNYCQDWFALELSKSLHNLTNLQFLNLSENYIGDAGAVAVAESLKNLKNLRKIDFQKNYVKDEGFKAINQAIKYPCEKLFEEELIEDKAYLNQVKQAERNLDYALNYHEAPKLLGEFLEAQHNGDLLEN